MLIFDDVDGWDDCGLVCGFGSCGVNGVGLVFG